MANTSKKNTPKPKAKSKNDLPVETENEISVKEVVKDERTHKIFGFFIILLSVLLFVALLSYCSTWKHDQDKVFNAGGDFLFVEKLQVDNLLGRIGAWISFKLMNGGFGLAALLLPVIPFALGANNVFKKKIFSISKTIFYIVTGTIYISMCLAMAFGGSEFSYGGGVGEMLSGYLTNLIGAVGTWLFLAVAGLSFFIWRYNLKFKLPENKPAFISKAEEAFKKSLEGRSKQELQPETVPEPVEPTVKTTFPDAALSINDAIAKQKEIEKATSTPSVIPADTGNSLSDHNELTITETIAVEKPVNKGYESGNTLEGEPANVNVVLPKAAPAKVDPMNTFALTEIEEPQPQAVPDTEPEPVAIPEVKPIEDSDNINFEIPVETAPVKKGKSIALEPMEVELVINNTDEDEEEFIPEPANTHNHSGIRLTPLEDNIDEMIETPKPEPVKQAAPAMATTNNISVIFPQQDETGNDYSKFKPFDESRPMRIEYNEDTDIDLEIKAGKLELEATEDEDTFDASEEEFKPYDPLLDLRDYKMPTLDLLELHGSEKIITDPQELEDNKNQIINTLKNYDITIQRISATVGPTVTLYEIVPAPGVRISRIKNLEDDIALSLAALGIRIIAPIPGKGTIGIEVPNARKKIVSMRTLLGSEKFQNSTFSLPIAIGKKIDNELLILDLAAMPHLLMAGATGQGKSVGLNAILVSLLYKMHPSQLKFVLVDPKKVELSIYRRIEKHYLAKLPDEDEAIITDTKKVVNTLNALCIEMDNRYDLLKEAGVRNIKEYNERFIARRLNPLKGHQYLPFIVLVVDEFADLIMTAGKEVEMPIARLAQLARAVGIHLIIATQRPSVNIITGTIKANFPGRIAFKVSSKIDSRTILDAGGADQLIGKGDMLVNHNGDLIRVQCAFVDTPEVERIVDTISDQRGYPDAFLLPEYIDENEKEAKDFDLSTRDKLFDEAARLIVQNQVGSTSLIQRRMKLGYNRAGRLMDQLEAAGIVSENRGSKPRDVLVRTEEELEEILNSL
ncbi:DNA translocase FtsK [Polluticaenibacter yanchengensis]|uniref:DNA translocase FtsK 4TM domain-containing protein n=1 Tax=Polluticaenibacter yanchengensis TaxID=3014562 RepID=A0ABT4UHI1_9BACT|nr:DNA translocase FtsK 4TM domain-containing protein [Chitinophagaceae bacterium LY-5]